MLKLLQYLGHWPIAHISEQKMHILPNSVSIRLVQNNITK